MKQKDICTKTSHQGMIKAFDGLDFFYQLESFRSIWTWAETWLHVRQRDLKIIPHKAE